MGKTLKKQTVLIIAVLMLGSGTALRAQLDMGKFVAGGTADAQKLFTAYLKPWAAGFGHDLNAGWYTTAKPHKMWGFDINFSANAAFVPGCDKTYDVSALGLSISQTPSARGYISPGPNGMIASTAAGPEEEGPELHYLIGGQDVSYTLPEGTGFSIVPSPMFQVGIGLIKHTELAVRFIPNISIADKGSVGLWGIAVKHDIMQWLPIVDKVPFLHLSVMGGYTKLNTSLDMDVTTDDIGLSDPPDPSVYEDQKLDLGFQSYTANLLASIDIPVISVFVGAGISSTKADLSLHGNYPMPTATDPYAYQKDPLDITIKDKDGKTTKPRLSAGLKIKMGPVHLFGEYTYAKYSLVTAGLAVSIR